MCLFFQEQPSSYATAIVQRMLVRRDRLCVCRSSISSIDVQNTRAEDVLVAPYLYRRFDKSATMRLVDALKPERALILVLDPSARFVF